MEVVVVRITGIAPICCLPCWGQYELEVLCCSLSRAWTSSRALQRKLRTESLLLILIHLFLLFHLLFSLELQSASESTILRSKVIDVCMHTYYLPMDALPQILWRWVLNTLLQFNYAEHPHHDRGSPECIDWETKIWTYHTHYLGS